MRCFKPVHLDTWIDFCGFAGIDVDFIQPGDGIFIMRVFDNLLDQRDKFLFRKHPVSQQRAFTEMLDQIIRIQGPVVMEIMTARILAGIKSHAFMRRSVFCYLLMTKKTDINRLCEPVFCSYFRLVFGMAGRALQRIDLRQQIRISRILEFLGRVRVQRLDPVLTVAVNACFLQHLTATKRVGMACITGIRQLVMPG